MLPEIRRSRALPSATHLPATLFQRLVLLRRVKFLDCTFNWAPRTTISTAAVALLLACTLTSDLAIAAQDDFASQVEHNEAGASKEIRLVPDDTLQKRKFATSPVTASNAPETANKHRRIILEGIYDRAIQSKGQTTAQRRFCRGRFGFENFKTDLRRLTQLDSGLAAISAIASDKEKEIVRSLVNEKNELKQKIRKQLEPYQNSATKIDYHHLRAELKTEEVFLDFYAHRSGEMRKLLVVVVRKNKPIKLIRLGWVDPIVNAATVWIDGQGESAPAQRAGLKLRDALWKPVSEFVEKGNEIIVSPDGVVCLVSFAALPSNTAGRFLIEDHMFTYQMSARSLVSSRREIIKKDTEPKLLAIGAPELKSTTCNATSTRFAPLPGAAEEITEIKKLFRKYSSANQLKALTQPNATVDSLIQNADQFTHIHIATHGFGNGQEQVDEKLAQKCGTFSNAISDCHAGFIFSNCDSDASGARNYLTANDVAKLDLSGTSQVVLSGCNTGCGILEHQEGAASLQRAFHIAGARTVVSSVWKVPDADTKKLMLEFYKNIFEKGMTKGSALREAQIKMLQDASSPRLSPGPRYSPVVLTKNNLTFTTKHRLRSPYKWGGFILSGDNN